MAIKNKIFFSWCVIGSSLLFSCTGGNVSSTISSLDSSSGTADVTVDGFGVSPTDKGTATVRIFKNNNSTSTSRFIPPSKVNMKFSYNDLSGTLSNNENVCPSIGDVNLLVIPVHIPGSDEYMTDEVREDIETMFFSEDSSRLGYKSVKEFYRESSFGKLNFSGKVTEWFDASTVKDSSGNQLINSPLDVTHSSDSNTVIDILEAATKWAFETQGISREDYDKNQDGSIDAIWLVYDHLDVSTDYGIAHAKDPNVSSSQFNSTFWNFTGWDYDTDPDYDNPTTSGFSWASFDMMYTSYAERDSNDNPDFSSFASITLDSHVFIHETGHLLGLDDYYASDDSSYRPAGQFTMMDQNVCDLDSYSKMLLGWVTPYVVYGTSEIVIPTAGTNDHAVIVIPSNYEEISDEVETRIERGTIDSFTYDFNPFSEYLMIDLYAPEGLNEKDVYNPMNDRTNAPSNTGIRIYHIDSRIFKCTVVNYDGGQLLSYDIDNNDYIWDGEELEDNQAILMAISNNKTEYSSFQLPSNYDYFDQIRLFEAGGINTFDTGGAMTEDTLWQVGDAPFSVENFGYQFFNGNYTFNDSTDLPFLIEVKTLVDIF